VPILRQPEGLLQQEVQELALRQVRKKLSLAKLRRPGQTLLDKAAVRQKMSNCAIAE
jgi:hypothetical protein